MFVFPKGVIDMTSETSHCCGVSSKPVTHFGAERRDETRDANGAKFEPFFFTSLSRQSACHVLARYVKQVHTKIQF